MDGFDDLLKDSRSNPILDNPFEDPFARPRSPDPWLTFSQQADESEGQTPTGENPAPSVPPSTEPPQLDQISNSNAVDPLDAKTANQDDEAEQGHRTPTPRASDAVSSLHPSPTTSPITGTPAAGPEKILASELSQSEAHSEASGRQTSPIPVAQDFPQKEHVIPATLSLTRDGLSSPPISEATPENPSSPPARTDFTPIPEASRPPVISPLESGSTHGKSSFNTLALGGEMPGWQPSLSQSTFVNQVHDPMQDGANGTIGWNEHTNGGGFINGTPAQEDSDDDNLPIARVLPATQLPATDHTRISDIQPMFVILVGDPQKVGDPVRPFITYTVHTKTTSPLYRRSAFSVLRRYSDFLWLYETLSINNPGVIVPPVPEKQQYGRFEDTFVENRRAALNKCIQKIANHPSLRDDPDLKLFLESDSFVLDIKHRKAEIAHERGGLMATIGSSLVGPKFYETDEWFDNKKAYLDSLESQLRGLVKAIDMVSKQRNEVAVAMADFTENIAALSMCDVGKQLSQTLSVLADVQRKAKELQDIQAREDVSTVMSTVDEYARLVNSVRLAFSSRVRLYVASQHADSDLKKSQQTHEKARRQGRMPSDRLGNSLVEIAAAERRAMEAKQEFDNASKLIKSELARFEQERVEDFRNALMSFLEGMVSRQKEIIQAWEGYQEVLLKRLGSKPTV